MVGDDITDELGAPESLKSIYDGLGKKGKFSQTTFSFICCRLPNFCRRFLQFALHFRDSYQIERKWMSYGQKSRPRRCPEPELFALRTLMIIQGREAFC
jgi:hypothetical protein